MTDFSFLCELTVKPRFPEVGCTGLSVTLAGNEMPARYQSEAVFVSLSVAVGAVQCLVDAIRPFSSTENRSESMTHHTSSPANKA